MKFRNQIVRIISICSTLILILSFSAYVSAQTAEQRYKNYTVIPSVLEQNLKKMERINNYGPEFVLDYIAEGGNYSEIISTLLDIELLSDALCEGLTNDYAKITVLAKYVSDTVAYDFDAAHNSVTFDVICLKNVLTRKRSTCAGYSNLFSALLNAQGIYCVNIRGCSPESENGIYISNLDSKNAAINHEWTAAWYAAEQRWIYVDCTWNSRNAYSDGAFTNRASVTTFFDIPIELLSIEHRAEIVDYRDFFSAPEAFNEDGIRWSELPEQSTTPYTTVTTPQTSKKPAQTTAPSSTPSRTTTPPDAQTATPAVTAVPDTSPSEDSEPQSSAATTVPESGSGEDITSVAETGETAGETTPPQEKSGIKKEHIVTLVLAIVSAGGGIAYSFIRKKKSE